MNTEELRQLLVTAGYECKIQRDEVVMKVCYFCGNDRWNLGLNPAKGVFYPWCCTKGGRLQDLLRELTGETHFIPVQRGERAPAPQAKPAGEFTALSVAQVPSALNYLATRGISAEVCARYEVVVCVTEGHRLYGRIVFPARDFWSGEVVGWIGRSYTAKHPKYLTTMTRKVITGWRTRDKMTPAVVVEGSLDGLVVHQAGFQAAVLAGVGASGVVEWAARLPQTSRVAIALDAEAIQQADQLYWQLQPILGQRLAVVRLTGKQDPASVGPNVMREIVELTLHQN